MERRYFINGREYRKGTWDSLASLLAMSTIGYRIKRTPSKVEITTLKPF